MDDDTAVAREIRDRLASLEVAMRELTSTLQAIGLELRAPLASRATATGDEIKPRPIESFPDLLYIADMAEIFRVSMSRAYQLASEGAFTFAEHRPRVSRLSYSRERVRQYLAGELRGLTDRPATHKRRSK